MQRAYCLIRDQPWYRREAFERGLTAAGYAVKRGQPDSVTTGDVLLMWNRYGANDALATRFEAGGGRVLVAENGYLGAGGTVPKWDVHPGGPKPHHYYALAEGYHNGFGRWRPGGPERFAALGVKLAPWRGRGKYILVCPNRPFGPAGKAMPADWARHAQARLGKAYGMEARVRPHPGNDAPRRPLDADLEDAWAVAIWSSGAGIQALVRGIPVICEAPGWILRGAAMGDRWPPPERLPAFERMAWAQWTLTEIERGEPFNHLLSTAPENAVA